MEFNYESEKKKNPIKIIILIIALLVFGLILCASMIFTNTKIQIKSNSFEILAIEYIKNKYNLETTVYDIEDTIEVEMEETKNKEKVINLETTDGTLIDVLIIKNKNENYYADNYEEKKLKKDIEEYFVEKFGENIEVFINAGIRPMDGENMISQKYTKNIFTTINKENPQDLHVFLQIADATIDIESLTMNDFPEIFPPELKDVKRKIVIGKLDKKEDLNIVSPYDTGLYYDDEIETEIILGNYGTYIKEIRVLSEQIDMYKKFNFIKNDIFYILTPETIKNVSYDESASIKNLPEYEENFSDVKQLSGKYSFELIGDTISFVAININELTNINVSNLLDIDAIIKENNKHFRAYGYPVGDYLIFSLIPYEGTNTDFYLIKVYDN